MRFWQRALLTFVAMLAVSFVADLACSAWFGFELPSYAAGVIGGMTAVPVWEVLERIRVRGRNR